MTQPTRGMARATTSWVSEKVYQLQSCSSDSSANNTNICSRKRRKEGGGEKERGENRRGPLSPPCSFFPLGSYYAGFHGLCGLMGLRLVRQTNRDSGQGCGGMDGQLASRRLLTHLRVHADLKAPWFLPRESQACRRMCAP